MNASPFDANAERAPDDRPVRRAPPMPDRETGSYWLGSMTAEVQRHKRRADVAEAELARVRALIALHWEFTT
jgi:hypothetical protein